MKFTSKSKLELSDIALSTLFISNYMDKLESIDVKVYLYILYLLKNNEETTDANIIKKLGINEEELSFALDRLQTHELIIKNQSGFIIVDLKDKHVNDLYLPKSKPKRSKAVTEAEKARLAAAHSISESFFNGCMPIAWYTDIGVLFDNYKFDEEVMIALFHECSERKALTKNYVYKVADNWSKSGVKTFEQLEVYLDGMAQTNIIMKKISKALRLNRNLTDYEAKHIYTWVTEHNYGFDIIEEALKRTVTKSNPSISYINGILNNWHKKGYKTVADINTETKYGKSNYGDSKSKFKDYDKNEYDNLESLYDNV